MPAFVVRETGKERGLSQHRFHSVTHDPALPVLAAAKLTSKRHDSSVRGSLPKDDQLSMIFFNCGKNIPAFLRAKLEEASGEGGVWRRMRCLHR